MHHRHAAPGAESRPHAFAGRAGQFTHDLQQRVSLLGRKAIEKGFDLPKPLGLNVIGIYVDQNIDISDLGLGTNDNPIVTTDFIGFGTNTSSVTTFNARADLWVLPLRNVYAIGGTAWANTTVEVAQPISFTTSVDQTGTYFGTGSRSRSESSAPSSPSTRTGP